MADRRFMPAPRYDVTGLGAITDAVAADDLAERRFDLIAAVVAALVFGLAALVERSRTRRRAD